MAATALTTITISSAAQGSMTLIRQRDGGIKFTDNLGNVTILRSPDATKLFEKIGAAVTTTTTTTSTTTTTTTA